MTDSQRILLNALVFAKITIDAHDVTDQQLADPTTPPSPSAVTTPTTAPYPLRRSTRMATMAAPDGGQADRPPSGPSWPQFE
jgi:hypothetical protein